MVFQECLGLVPEGERSLPLLVKVRLDDGRVEDHRSFQDEPVKIIHDLLVHLSLDLFPLFLINLADCGGLWVQPSVEIIEEQLHHARVPLQCLLNARRRQCLALQGPCHALEARSICLIAILRQ